MIEDATFGGYLSKHDRSPAFEGPDGAAYSAAVYVDDEPEPDGRYGAAVLFVRWSTGGDQPVGHVETPIVAWGASPDDAQMSLLALSLHDLKELLDRAVAHSRQRPDW